MARRQRTRKAKNKTVQKVTEKQTEAEKPTETENNDEDKTVKGAEAVSPSECDANSKEDTTPDGHVESDEKKRKHEASPTEDTTSKNNKKVKKIDAGSAISIRIERWNATQLSEELKKAFPDMQIVINPEKPRSKSFEVTLCYEDSAEVLVWSGIKKGPPRKLKFPDDQKVIESIQKHLGTK